MRHEAAQVVHRCAECQRWTIRQQGFHPLRPIYAELPFDHVATDLLQMPQCSHEGFNYVLILVDVATRFVILRSLQSKEAPEVYAALLGIFADFGFPKIIQSDNGKEFVNGLVKQLTSLNSTIHRLTTPYHPRANGLAERQVQQARSLLMKLTESDLSHWQTVVPWTQLQLNLNVSRAHGSTPFSLMFGRICNQFTDYKYEEIRTLPPDALKARMDHMYDTVYPAIRANMAAYQNRLIKNFDSSHHILPDDTFPNGSYVMTIPDVRASKAEARYEGPFKVVHRTKGGTYQLLDSDGLLLPRKYAPSQLKLVADDTNFRASATIKAIKNHRRLADGSNEYLVQWTADTPNSWVPYADFNDHTLIKAYMASLNPIKPFKRRRGEGE
jgi:transposase InsO family protein